MYTISEINLFGKKTGARSQVKILDFIESVKRYGERYSRNLRDLENEEGVPPRMMRELRKIETKIESVLGELEKLKRKYRIR